MKSNMTATLCKPIVKEPPIGMEILKKKTPA